MSKLGIQSYCYRGIKELSGLISAVKASGVDCIELCGVHADFYDVSKHAATIAAFKERRIRIASIGVNNIGTDLEQARPLFEFVKAAGTRHISISFDIHTIPVSFRIAERLADEYDVRLGIHNHGGYDWLGNLPSLSWVFAQTSKRIGLSLDTAWAMQTGRDPLKYVELFGDRLSLLHIKDFTFDRAARWTDVVAGSGNLNLAALQESLDQVGYTGDVIIEYEGDVDNPVPALQQCVAAVRAAMKV